MWCVADDQTRCLLTLQDGQGVVEKRLQWALSRLASLEGRVLRLESSAPSY